MSPESRAAIIRENLRQDMHTTLVMLGVNHEIENRVVEALLDDGMFQIEHLLAEIDGLRHADG
jgi:hypothetical protein